MKLELANARAKPANKVALETKKEKDAAEKAVEELKRQLQPTRVQNRRNVQGGSRDNQQKPRPDKDGFLLHSVLVWLGGLHIDAAGTLFWQWLSTCKPRFAKRSGSWST